MGLLREPLLHFFLLGAGLFVVVAATKNVRQDRLRRAERSLSVGVNFMVVRRPGLPQC